MVLFQPLSEGTVENHDILSQDSLLGSPDMKQECNTASQQNLINLLSHWLCKMME
jgi:hypothetical protein